MSDLVQDFQEFVSPNDSPICQRDALGVIAELINVILYFSYNEDRITTLCLDSSSSGRSKVKNRIA